MTSDRERQLLGFVGDLEVVYALALDMPSKPLSDSSIQHVWEAVAKLKSLIATKLQQV
jgi:hypothetical protein